MQLGPAAFRHTSFMWEQLAVKSFGHVLAQTLSVFHAGTVAETLNNGIEGEGIHSA